MKQIKITKIIKGGLIKQYEKLIQNKFVEELEQIKRDD